jgi:chitin disaccharide deacetylase
VSGERLLIVNADDFGLSPGVNAGVIEAHERGIVTSASLMVRRDAAAEAAAYAHTDGDLSLGLHVDLGEWSYRDGEWVPVYEVVPLEEHAAVEAEVRNQLAAFRRLAEADPTHLDSHQHVHDDDAPAAVLRDLARKLDVPLRNHNPRVRYCGDLYGRAPKGDVIGHAITVDNLVEILTGLTAGITELGCHPGRGADADSEYLEEREAEVRVLCDTRVRETIERERIALRSFRDVTAGNG